MTLLSSLRYSSSLSLEHVLAHENLVTAFDSISSRERYPGYDGLLPQDLDFHSHITPLCESIHIGKYFPCARLEFYIAKSRRKKRRILIGSVIDAVLERAFAKSLSVAIDPIFHPCSYGSRPATNAHAAIAMWQHITLEGFVWVVSLDIANFFDQIPRGLLLERLQQVGVDGQIIQLSRRFFDVPIIRQSRLVWYSHRGIGQGPCYSPFFGNLYLDQLDQFLSYSGLHFLRYLDDVLILSSSEEEAKSAQAHVSDFIMRTLHLKTNSKTCIRQHWGARFLGFSIGGDGAVMVANGAGGNVRKLIHYAQKRGDSGHLALVSNLSRVIGSWLAYYGVAVNAMDLVNHEMAGVLPSSIIGEVLASISQNSRNRTFDFFEGDSEFPSFDSPTIGEGKRVRGSSNLLR